MIEYLQKLKGKDSNNLTEKEKLELEHLKTQLQKYKEKKKKSVKVKKKVTRISPPNKNSFKNNK